MALLPRRKWTNSLAWSVWAQRRNNKRRAGGDIPPPLNQRYFTQLDGQSKYWRRIEPDYGQTTNATLDCLFYGGSGSGLRYLEGRHSNDRFYIALQGNQVVFGSGADGGLSPTTVDLTKINHAKLVADGTNITFFVNGVEVAQIAQAWSGLLDEVGFGVKGDQLQEFYDGILVSARVTTDTVDNVYELDDNLPYDLPDGVTLGPELWVNPNLSSVWTDNGGGSYSSAGGNGNITESTAPVVDAFGAVECEYTISNYVSGSVRAFCYGTANAGVGAIENSNGVFKEILTLTSPTSNAPNRVLIQSTDFVGTLSEVSFKAVPNSALIFENGSIDGSDRLLVTEKQDGTGFVGETGINYDYATGANPEASTYSSEYSSEYS